MKVLVLGSTGLLGQAMSREVEERGWALRGAARQGASVRVDISDETALTKMVAFEAPDVIVNCAATVDIETCEQNSLLAWRVNARPLAFLAEWSRSTDRALLHISTDHFFVDGNEVAHDEDTSISLVNEYARTKFAGEAFALTASRALVLRTSIVGIRGWERPTFAEWAIDVAMNDRAATLFGDAYTSSIDVTTFARASFELVVAERSGLLNLAASQVYSKQAFVREIASQLGRNLTATSTGTVRSLAARRANCLGLNVDRAELLLGYKLPTLELVVASILRQRLERSKT